MGWKIRHTNTKSGHSMIFTEIENSGAYVIEIEKKIDERGFFARVRDKKEFETKAKQRIKVGLILNEYGEQNRQIQDLSNWAKNGVLLLNTVLTVEKGKPNSHKKIGWNIFTDGVIKLLNDSDKPIVFILWGNDAQTKEPLISNNKHLIIKSPHPSPFSARKGFFGSKCFSKANDFLQENRNQKISWI